MRKRRGREAALPLLCSFSYCRHVKLSKMSLGITEVAQHLKNFLSSIWRCVIFSELYTQPISFWYYFISSLLSLSNTTYKFLRPRIELPGRCSCRNELCEICMHIRCWHNINWCSSPINKASLIFCSQEQPCSRSGNTFDCPCSKHTSLCWKPTE